MKERINVAELLKDCPKGMELDCTMFDNVTFVGVNNSRQFPIETAIGGRHSKYLTKEGCFHDTTLLPEAKCVIFPKGKTTWEGFQRPFKDGDIVATQNGIWIGIHKRMVGNAHEVYLAINHDCLIYNDNIFCFERLATEEEKEKLFQVIKDNGYKWDDETKTLEKLIRPKFKVGDRIRHKQGGSSFTITEITDGCYKGGIRYAILITQQDNFELVPDKFDITTLKPYQKVLFRQSEDCIWLNSFFGFYDKNNKTHPFICCNGFAFKYCIPYEKNKHLLGTTDDCDEYYKTWE